MAPPSPFTTSTAIHEWIESLKTEGAGIVKIGLRSATSAQGATIWNRPLAANGDSSKLAEQALNRAQSTGAAMPCVRATFLLHALDVAGESVDQLMIVVAGGNAGKGESAEEGTAQERFIGHMLRGYTDLHRLLISSTEGRNIASERLITQQAAALDAHERRRVNMIELHERLLSGEAQREHLLRQDNLDEKRQDMMGKKLDLILPIAVNRLLGGGPGKGTPFMGEEMVKRLLADLKPETIEALMKTLPPEQSALFAELYMAYAEAEKKREINEAAAKTANGTTNGINQPPPKGDPS